MHKINQNPPGKRIWPWPKECEKLLITKRPNPLPLPTLKLSEPPGAVRPDGDLTALPRIACLPDSHQ